MTGRVHSGNDLKLLKAQKSCHLRKADNSGLFFKADCEISRGQLDVFSLTPYLFQIPLKRVSGGKRMSYL